MSGSINKRSTEYSSMRKKRMFYGNQDALAKKAKVEDRSMEPMENDRSVPKVINSFDSTITHLDKETTLENKNQFSSPRSVQYESSSRTSDDLTSVLAPTSESASYQLPILVPYRSVRVISVCELVYCARCDKTSELVHMVNQSKCNQCGERFKHKCARCGKLYAKHRSLLHHLESPCHIPESESSPSHSSSSNSSPTHTSPTHGSSSNSSPRHISTSQSSASSSSPSEKSTTKQRPHHSDSGYKCSKCQKIFKRHAHKMRHQNDCGNTVIIPCKLCNYQTTKSRNIIDHCRNKHGIYKYIVT